MSVPTKEGTIPFSVPSLSTECSTWYKVVGDLSGTHPPVIALHGGPGACHDYLLPLIDLWTLHQIPVIFYDQIGNGRSTHLRDKREVAEFWTVDLFISELDNLIDHFGLRDKGFHILGQSWGGVLGSDYATRQPKGLLKLALCNSPASLDLWVKAAAKLKSGLPKKEQEILDRCERERDYENPEYKAAVEVFYRRHFDRTENYPSVETKAMLDWIENDDTTYLTMNGPSEFTVIGNLRNWSIIDQLHKISVSTLLINGSEDEAQDLCVQPFFDNIPKVKWVCLDKGGHMTHVEQRPKFMEIVGHFFK